MTMTQLSEFRREKDQFFALDSQSPLTPDQKRAFHGLSYFPENADLRMEVRVEPFPQQDIIQMQTSTGSVQRYTRYGQFKFMVGGKVAELTIYASQDGFFLPFADSLAGTETYGAGRYLEPEHLGGNRFLIDFNLAYNPYCAYNDQWTCPVTPPENRLGFQFGPGRSCFILERHRDSLVRCIDLASSAEAGYVICSKASFSHSPENPLVIYPFAALVAVGSS